MTEIEWNAFCEFKNGVKDLCKKYEMLESELKPLIEAAFSKDTPFYTVENCFVYNRAWDNILKDDEIKLIVIGDNPGKEEQTEEKHSYLVGQSGRIAEGFFRRNAELGVDFRKNVIIANKTPFHTAKTKHIQYVEKNGSAAVKNMIVESQKEMARLLYELQKKTLWDLWLVGYSEMKKNGIFTVFKEEMKQNCMGTDLWDRIFVYQHFSMNRFLIDLKTEMENSGKTLKDTLVLLGKKHKDEIFA